MPREPPELIGEDVTFGSPKPGVRRPRRVDKDRKQSLPGGDGKQPRRSRTTPLDEVEARAISIVKRYATQAGASVGDVQSQNRGWDLEFAFPRWAVASSGGQGHERRWASDPHARRALRRSRKRRVSADLGRELGQPVEGIPSSLYAVRPTPSRGPPRTHVLGGRRLERVAVRRDPCPQSGAGFRQRSDPDRRLHDVSDVNDAALTLRGSLAATTLAQYVRLESCERYLWYRLHAKETRELFREYRVTGSH